MQLRPTPFAALEERAWCAVTKSCEEAFAVVDAIRDDRESRTRGVDAFALALIRSERQIRRIFTNVVYQASAFERAHVCELNEALSQRRRLYFQNFQNAFAKLIGVAISELIADYSRLGQRLIEAKAYRDKLFHGQLTGDSLTTEHLLLLEDDIRLWCVNLSDGAQARFGYDGFEGDTSFVKTGRAEITAAVDMKIASIEDYREFLVALEARRPK